MKMSNKEIKMIEQLNSAYFDIQNALKVIKYNTDLNKEDGLYLWRIEKNLDALYRIILKKLKSNVMEDEFQKITKMLQK